MQALAWLPASSRPVPNSHCYSTLSVPPSLQRTERGPSNLPSWGHLHSSVELGGESAKHATCVGLLTFALKDGLQWCLLPLLGSAAPEEEGTRDVESFCGHPPTLAMRI